jgi:hypothetical protein
MTTMRPKQQFPVNQATANQEPSLRRYVYGLQYYELQKRVIPRMYPLFSILSKRSETFVFGDYYFCYVITSSKLKEKPKDTYNIGIASNTGTDDSTEPANARVRKPESAFAPTVVATRPTAEIAPAACSSRAFNILVGRH